MLFNSHVKKINEYKIIRDYYTNLKSEDTLVLNFDYSQNHPLPKLPNCEVFYKRLLWFFIFNIHIYYPKLSYFFYSIEGLYSKNGNSVCSYIFKLLNELNFYNENKQIIKEIILLSDATSSQNRNHSVLKFCLFLSIKYQI